MVFKPITLQGLQTLGELLQITMKHYKGLSTNLYPPQYILLEHIKKKGLKWCYCQLYGCLCQEYG